MKAIVKRYFQEFLDCIEFPTVIYVYESGRIYAMNNSAMQIIGRSCTNFNKLWKETKGISLTEEEMECGTKVIFNQKYWDGPRGYEDLDLELNIISLDQKHLVVCCMNYSYRQSFVRHERMKLPRLAYRNRKSEYDMVNRACREDANIAMEVKMPIVTGILFDEETTEQMDEDAAKVFFNKQPQYNIVQLLRRENTLGYMARINRCPVINKNGTVVGMLCSYTLIFSREEYKMLYDITLRENNILSQIISQSETIVLSWTKDIDYHVEYVSSNISHCGFTAGEVYNKSIRLEDVITAEEYQYVRSKLRMLEAGVLEHIDLELPIRYKENPAIWMKVYVGIIWKTNYVYTLECIAQDITEKKHLEFRLQSSGEFV